MNKTLSILIASLCISINAYSNNIIEGKIKNVAKGTEVTLTKHGISHYLESEILSTSKVDENGSFRLSFNLNNSSILSLRIGLESTRMFMSPEDSVFVELDYKKFDETIYYSGKGGLENNFMALTVLRKDNGIMLSNNLEDNGKKYEEEINKQEEEFFKFINKNFNVNFSKDFTLFLNAQKKYKYIRTRAQFEIYYDASTKQFKSRTLSNEYAKFFDNVALDEDDNLISSDYVNALESFVSWKNKSLRNTDTSINAEILYSINLKNYYSHWKTQGSKKVRDLILFNLLSQHLEYQASIAQQTFDSLLNDYSSYASEDLYVKSLQSKVEKLNPLLAGKPFPTLTLLNASGEEFNTNSLKGKVLLIDFWATWCGPCLVGMPKLEETALALKENTQFSIVRINVNDQKESWQKFIEKKSGNYLELFADARLSKEIEQLLQVKGIPRYMLIDKNGNFVESNYYINPKTVEQINALSNE
jgi:thiol-disulfide isomerase/thioredoxin